MTAPESLRDEVAAAVYDATRSKSNRVSWADFGELSKDYWRGIADALLASPAFARVTLSDEEMERRLRSALQTYWPESGGQTGHAKAVEAQDRIVREVLR